MSSRRKWQLRWVPSGSTERVPSSTSAYEAVNEQRKWVEGGQSDITSVLVQFDDGDGFGWQTYERIDFHTDRPGGAS
jgi:hypothetical protein